MQNINRLSSRPLAVFMAFAMFWSLSVVSDASAQYRLKPDNLATIDAGTTIAVRTDETIDSSAADGRVFTGTVDRDVLNRYGRVAIPEGADVELVVRQISNTQLALDLDSIIVNNQRYGIQTENSITTGDSRRDGIGANSRTGKYVGGGALLGAVIGGIAGGGKGALLGAGVGAAGGAGAQILTRGRSVRVPAESLLTFRLQQPMQLGVSDVGFTNDGRHYHPGYSTQPRTLNQGVTSSNGASVRIRGDNQVSWQAPAGSRVYVIVDNNARKLFAEGTAGTQDASWMIGGHRYIFVVVDADGYEIARDVMDLR